MDHASVPETLEALLQFISNSGDVIYVPPFSMKDKACIRKSALLTNKEFWIQNSSQYSLDGTTVTVKESTVPSSYRTCMGEHCHIRIFSATKAIESISGQVNRENVHTEV